MKEASDLLRDGDQLRLDLFRSVPWDGLSPRGLTRGSLGLFSRQKPPRHEVFFDPEQLELWPVEGHTEVRAAPGSPGAVPLGGRVRGPRRGRLFSSRGG